jgi:hypothetical protein
MPRVHIDGVAHGTQLWDHAANQAQSSACNPVIRVVVDIRHVPPMHHAPVHPSRVSVSVLYSTV